MKKSIYMSHFAVQQRLIQHCKSTILQLKKNVRLLSALSLSCRWEVIVDIPVMWECFIMIMNLFCTNSIHIWLSGEIFFFLNFKRPIGQDSVFEMLLFFCFADRHFLRCFWGGVSYLLIELKEKLFNVCLGALARKNIFIFDQFLAWCMLAAECWVFKSLLNVTFFPFQ